jgi:hypothetical protein
MLPQDGEETIAVPRLNEMGHLVHNDVFEEVLRFFHKFRIKPRLVITASLLRFHPSQEIAIDLYLQLRLPLPDEGRDHLVEKRFVQFLLSTIDTLWIT